MLGSILVAAIGVAVGIATVVLTRMQRNDAWFVTYEKLHDEFWKDPVMAKVRAQVANDHAYAPLKDVLERRKQRRSGSNAKDVTPQDYTMLEDLDKFLSQLLRMSFIPRTRPHKKIWEALVRAYWLDVLSKRSELRWYVQEFYTHFEKADPELWKQLQVANSKPTAD
jgi:hypothetical protein